jgi:signal transduction histidine kinase/ligand-binding sensor domain-containing protein
VRARTRRWRLPGALLLLLPLLAWADAGADQVRPQQLSSWSMQRGAPADIWAIAQGARGFLWLGTGTGLYRFDGVTFEHIAPPRNHAFASSNITALKVLDDGTLWIGFYNGGVAAMHGDAVRRFGQGEGFPAGMVQGFATRDDGSLWAATSGGLARFDGQRWKVVGGEMGYPTHEASWVLAARDGSLWAATGHQLVVLPRGSRQFHDTGIAVGRTAVLAQAPDGTLWLSDHLHGTRALPGLDATHACAVDQSSLPATGFAAAKRLLFDRDGQLWGTDAREGGVYRVRQPAQISGGRPLQAADIDRRYRQGDGLTSDIAVPLQEDREGNVWVGTNLGLNSFRPSDVVPLEGVGLSPVAHYALSISPAGEVWLTYGGVLYRIEHGAPVAVVHGLPDPAAIVATQNTDVWFLAGDGLQRIRNGKPEPVALPPGTDVWSIESMTGDRSGALWASFSRHGVYRYSDGVWTAWPAGGGSVPGAPVTLAAGRDGSLLLGYAGSTLEVAQGTHARRFGKDEGLDVGAVTAITAEPDEVLVGGDTGLARLRDRHLATLTQERVGALRGISGIVRSPDGMLWINTSAGIVRIADEELDRALNDPAHPVDYRLFDSQDGLKGVALQASVASTAGRDADGRLWFATNQGVSSIDPPRIHRNRLPPPVIIRALVVGGRDYPAASDIELPKQTGNLRIRYTATSLTVPERVRFRYRLEGVDDEWQDAGNRREAFYTNLAPGHYRFQVIASNDDGVWNRLGDSVTFFIPPLFYQTRWFLGLSILAGLAAIFALFLLRIRQAAIRVHLRLEERHAERERIARELHDTLLQATQGLVLRFQAVAERIPPGDPVRAMIDRTLDRADEVLVEGRDRVNGLRASTDIVRDLAGAFAVFGEELFGDDPQGFGVIVEGTVRTLDPMVREELYRIGYEATVNAVQHAQADRIEVELDYGLDELRLRVRDNGKGIDGTVLEAGGKPGHWGLAGMRERAERVGGSFAIWSRAGTGTEVDIRLPASIAYDGGRPSWMTRLRQLVSGGRYA